MLQSLSPPPTPPSAHQSTRLGWDWQEGGAGHSHPQPRATQRGLSVPEADPDHRDLPSPELPRVLAATSPGQGSPSAPLPGPAPRPAGSRVTVSTAGSSPVTSFHIKYPVKCISSRGTGHQNFCHVTPQGRGCTCAWAPACLLTAFRGCFPADPQQGSVQGPLLCPELTASRSQPRHGPRQLPAALPAAQAETGTWHVPQTWDAGLHPFGSDSTAAQGRSSHRRLFYPVPAPFGYSLCTDPAALSYCPASQKRTQSHGGKTSPCSLYRTGHVTCAPRAGQPLHSETFGTRCVLPAPRLRLHCHQGRAGNAKREPRAAPGVPPDLAAVAGSLAGSRGRQPGLGPAPEHPQGIHLLCTSFESVDCVQARTTHHPPPARQQLQAHRVRSAGEVSAWLSRVPGRTEKHRSPAASLSATSPQARSPAPRSRRAAGLLLPVQLHARTTGPAQASRGDATRLEAQLVPPHPHAASRCSERPSWALSSVAGFAVAPCVSCRG